jgi:CheY-like chemotaxis protein
VNEARQLQPAAILLDLLMPERNGEEVLSDLKRDPATRTIPVIVVSVIDSADAVNGADAHLSKPVSKEALLRVLSEHLPGKGTLPGKVKP